MSKGLSIEELAFKHLLSHPNDKSGQHLSKMSRRFGRTAAYEALDKAVEILTMTDPTNPAIAEYARHKANNNWRKNHGYDQRQLTTWIKRDRKKWFPFC